ncbi:MAG: ATP synthase F0 subunit C [Anaerolineaceae bacterium]
MSVEVAKYFAVGMIMFSLVGPAYAIGKIGAAGLDGMARNPEASGSLMTPMILAIAFAESLAIYALVITFIILFS